MNFLQFKKSIFCWACWRTPLIPTLGRQRQADFWVRGHPGLQSEFQDSQGYTEKPCLKKKNKNKKKIYLLWKHQLNDYIVMFIITYINNKY
jgi:hypothetical protein